MSTKVAILGSGISGLLAAWALESLNIPFVIYDKGPREVLPRIVPGCVYLHDTCRLPDAALRQATLWTQVLPPESFPRVPPTEYARMYHQKIWGNTPYVLNSVERLIGQVWSGSHDIGLFTHIYSMNHALVWLYQRYQASIRIQEIRSHDAGLLIEAGYHIISTIPIGFWAPGAPRISKMTWIVQLSEFAHGERTSGLPVLVPSTAMTIYNIDPLTSWYRASSMFGFYAIEFVTPPGREAQTFQKIISGPDPEEIQRRYGGKVMLTGRWGRWERGFLSHQSYHDVLRRFGNEK